LEDKNTPNNIEREPAPEEELVAYLDGELDSAATERLEAVLAEDPALREALSQHEAIAEAISSPRKEAGPEPRETLTRVHARMRRARTKVISMRLAAAACLVLAVAIGASLFTGNDPVTPAGPRIATPVEDPASQPEVLADLDVLEVLQEEGGEISLELVNLLLEEDGGTGVLDSGLFNDWLEEEITGENF
jgi:hypothetical protein